MYASLFIPWHLMAMMDSVNLTNLSLGTIGISSPVIYSNQGYVGLGFSVYSKFIMAFLAV